MSDYRFTSTRKWDDPWFSELTLEGKVLFIYLCDRCDLGGFIERNDKVTSAFTNIPVNNVSKLTDSMGEKIVFSGAWMWIKNFVRNQNNLPLNPSNNAHRKVYRLLATQEPRFGSYYISAGVDFNEVRTRFEPGYDDVITNPSKGQGKGRVKKNKLKFIYLKCEQCLEPVVAGGYAEHLEKKCKKK